MLHRVKEGDITEDMKKLCNECGKVRKTGFRIRIVLIQIRIHRVLLEGGGPPLYSQACVAGVYLIKVFNKESLIYPLHLTQPNSPSARNLMYTTDPHHQS